MGYVNKTVSKNETLIKQAKICKLSFLDRYIAGGLIALAAIFAIVDIFAFDAINIGDAPVHLSSIAMIGVGAVLLVLALFVGLYKLMQMAFKINPDLQVSAGIIARLCEYFVLAAVIGAVSVVVGNNVLCEIVNIAAGIIFGGLIITLAILRYISIKLVVTDKRVFGRRNIWKTESYDLPIEKIDNIIIRFSFWGKMFNYATITIKSVLGEYKIKYVKSPEEFKNQIIDFTAYAGE